jgi:fluoroacetyl-CoA thioesterase
MFDLRNVLLIGMNHTVQKLLTESDTASQYGRGSLEHLIATPAFVGLIIDASLANVEGRLPEGFVTVGISFNFMHDAPTCLGMTLRVKSTIRDISGDSILFDIVASDEYGTVGHGQHQRSVVNRAHLFEKATQRMQSK